MFSEAISSISSRWRPSSRRTTSAISGSVSASEAVNRLARSDGAGDGLVIDVTLLDWKLRPGRGVARAIAHRVRTAKLWARNTYFCPHLGGPVGCRLGRASWRGPTLPAVALGLVRRALDPTYRCLRSPAG